MSITPKILPRLELEDYDDLTHRSYLRALIESERTGDAVDFDFLSGAPRETQSLISCGLLMRARRNGRRPEGNAWSQRRKSALTALRLMQ